MLNSSSQFWRFCYACCDKNDSGEESFRELLDALRPVNPFENADNLSINPFSIPFNLDSQNPFPSIRVDNIVALTKRSGYNATASEVIELLRMLEQEGIAHSEIANVFQRCRTTMSSRWSRLRRIGDPSWMEKSFRFEFEKAIQWVKSGGRSPKAKHFTEKFYVWGLLVLSVVLLAVSITKSIRHVDASTYVVDWSMNNWAYGLLPALAAGIIWIGALVYFCLAHRETASAIFGSFMETWGLPLLIFAMGYGVICSVGAVRWTVLWKFAGIAFAITAGVELLIWGHIHSSAAGGDAIDSSHEWRIKLKDGRPGPVVGPTTRKDLYDHVHGHGAWDLRNARTRKKGTRLAIIMVPLFPLLGVPYLWISGVRGIAAFAGYFLIYPLFPVVLIIGIIYWLNKLYPPLKIR